MDTKHNQTFWIDFSRRIFHQTKSVNANARNRILETRYIWRADRITGSKSDSQQLCRHDSRTPRYFRTITKFA